MALHEVNTSVGLKPTNATNQWKLQTDPADPQSDPTEYTLGAELNNTYDPTQFSLAVSPVTGTYALGYSVEGIEPFQVTSFDVYDTNGGFYNVTADPTNALLDIVTPSNPSSQEFPGPVPNGTEAGIVNNIVASLIPSSKNQAQPSTVDQYLWELNLVALNSNPTIVPQNYSTSGGPGSYLEIGDPTGGTPPVFLTFPETTFDTSYVPEPAALSLAFIGVAGLAARRRRT